MSGAATTGDVLQGGAATAPPCFKPMLRRPAAVRRCCDNRRRAVRWCRDGAAVLQTLWRRSDGAPIWCRWDAVVLCESCMWWLLFVVKKHS